MTLLAWCTLGGVGALFIFFSLIFRYALFVMFLVGLVIAVWLNFACPGGKYELSTGVDDTFTPPSEP
ncbi:hypothetical protein BDV93DRAFT_529953 [Ceratobasidium sp. AG-I]|nr:hypothetical protein BDV93DRAFT_529953 [Ceratobasidium sp. AG-I]